MEVNFNLKLIKKTVSKNIDLHFLHNKKLNNTFNSDLFNELAQGRHKCTELTSIGCSSATASSKVESSIQESIKCLLKTCVLEEEPVRNYKV